MRRCPSKVTRLVSARQARNRGSVLVTLATMPDAISHEHFESAASLLDALATRGSRWPQARAWIFRGQADARWPLVPSVMREGVRFWGADFSGTSKGIPAWRTNLPRMIAEHTVIDQFIQSLDESGLAVPGEGKFLRGLFDRHVDPESTSAHLLQKTIRESRPYPPEELLPLYALAQHYGIPTRLLDWSYSPTIAAYFAAKGASAKHDDSGKLVIWGLNYTELSAISARPAPWNSELRVNAIRLVRAPAHTNPNLAAQRGIFTVDRRTTHEEDPTFGKQPLDEFIKEAAAKYSSDLVQTMMRSLTLPWSEAPKLLRLLAEEGVHAGRLFPGHQGAAEACRERLLWDKYETLTERVFTRDLLDDAVT